MATLLPNGNMRVPRRAESEEGVIGDGSEELSPDSEDYVRWIHFLSASADRKRAEDFAAEARRSDEKAA